ncbi:MAG: MBL fold metallo-hydrolase [Bacillaceae bacterium]
MKVTVLGFWGGYPEKAEATSGYLFEHDNYRLLVDCGSGVLAQLQTYISIEQIDAVILSHYHHDHIADVGVLQYARQIRSLNGVEMSELPIYGHGNDKLNFNHLTVAPYTKGIAYDPEEALKIGPFTITFLKTVHPVECYGMRITAGEHTVTYTADSSYLEELPAFAKDSDALIVDCNGYADQDMKKAGHMNSTECGKLAAKSHVKTLILSHLPHFRMTEDLVVEAMKEFDGKVLLAKTGLEIHF